MSRRLIRTDTHTECGACGKLKEHIEFASNSHRPVYRCKECVRVQWKEKRDAGLVKKRGAWRNHHVADEDYEAMFSRQDGKCLICKERKRLVVDHNHKCCPGKKSCGKCVRGLLCGDCNRFLGILEADRSRLHAMLEYLRSTE